MAPDLETSPGTTRHERCGTLVLLACHGVFDESLEGIHAEHPEDRPIYEAQLQYACQHVRWRAGDLPLLVISGGPTKAERRCSESFSYLEFAKAKGLPLPADIELEEFALTSVENILFSLYVYHRNRGAWPQTVEAISWEFKRERFEQALDAINRWPPLAESWPPLRFYPTGDLCGAAKTAAVRVEKAYIDSLTTGTDAYYALPATQEVLKRRDVFNSRDQARLRYAGYPLPF